MTDIGSTMLFKFGGQDGSEQSLVESTDKFIVRTKNGFNPKAFLETFDFSKYENRIKQLDFYPEASVYVYQLLKGNKQERDELKTTIKAYSHEKIEFIGTIMQRKDNGVYQIYTGNLFLKFKDGTDVSDHQRILNECDLTNKRKNSTLNSHAYFVEPKEKTGREIFALSIKLVNNPLVEFCHPEMVIKRKTIIQTTSSNQIDSSDEWASDMIKLKEAHKTSKGNGVTICVIDDGLETNHPAFQNTDQIINSRDMFMDTIGDASHKDTTENHGTACASVACANDHQVLGVAPEANLLPIRTKGLGSVLEAEAIYWAVEQGADIISCSWGPQDGDPNDPNDAMINHPLPDHTRLALEYAATKGRNGKGCLIFFAAGNGSELIEYDGYASNEHVMAIGAVNKEGKLTKYSDYGKSLFCCFPSSEVFFENEKIKTIYGIHTLDRVGKLGFSDTDYYTSFGGTSASCPGMAGAAALMLSVNPNLSLNECKTLIKEACYIPKNADKNQEKNLGAGIINVAKLLALTKQTTKNPDTKNHSIINSKTNNPVADNPIKNNTMTNQTKSKKIAIHIAVDELNQEIYKGQFSDLAGCVNDLNLFKEFTKDKFDIHELTNKQATRNAVIELLEKTIENTESGDYVIFTYSGHGGTVTDEDFDETDGKDETLVLHDGMLFDDEIRDFHLRFKKGVRIFWFTDSCHSGSNSRGTTSRSQIRNENSRNARSGNKSTQRIITTDILNGIYQNNKNDYNRIKKIPRSKRNAADNYAASIIHFAACDDSQFAYEENGNGNFSLLTYQTIIDNQNISYKDLFDKVVSQMPSRQTPQINLYGDTATFKQEQFLNISIDPQNLKVDSVNEEKQLTTDLLQCEDLIINNNDLQTFKPSNNTRGISSTIKARGELPTDSFKGNSAWDSAYDAYHKNTSVDKPFIEPNIASNIYANNLEEDGARGEANGYLPTYPIPSDPLWHLKKDYSQLNAALRTVCPEEMSTGKNIHPLNDYPLIVHIDTGVIKGSIKMRPKNWDEKGSNSFEDPYDRDLFLVSNSIEQQGHGNATLAILAGGKLDFKDDSLDSNMYFGGFPFARTASLRISHSVAILRGKNFADALNYAVDTLKADVVTMSMAGAPSKIMVDAVNHAYDKGVVVVTAGGNTWSKGVKKRLPKTIMYPARFNRVIAATGATFDKTPYQNKFNTEVAKAANGKFMQSCYGPAEAMRTAIAAYTPNILWFDKKGAPYYVKTGGGTSSATPQIAAAAALYIYEHRKVLSNIRDWRKVEVVRKALFSTADKSKHGKLGEIHTVDGKQYDQYFGNGTLRAKDALSVDAQTSLDLITENVNFYKEQEDSVGRTGIDELFKMWSQTRGTNNANTTLQEMIAMEIEQIIHLDPNLMDYTASEGITNEMKIALFKSEYSSKKLKEILKKSIGKLSKKTTRSANVYIDTTEIPISYRKNINKKKKEENVLEISMENISGKLKVNKKTKSKNGHVASFNIEIDGSASRSSAPSSISMSNKNDSKDLLFLISEEDENGNLKHYWPSPKGTDQKGSRSADEPTIHIDEDNVVHLDIPLTRGVLSKVKTFFVNVYRTVRDRPASKLEGLIYGSYVGKKIEWHEMKDATSDIKKEIRRQEKTIFFSHGTFSSVEGSFGDLIKNKKFRKAVAANGYGKYLLGYNMSTIRSGIEKNAKGIIKALNDENFDPSNYFIFGSSRGTLVARAAFSNEHKMILSAGPHFGTDIAKKENISDFLNRFTGLVISVGGVSAPSLSIIAFAVKQLIKTTIKSKGIQDMTPDSKVIKKLNINSKLTKNQLLIGMNYAGKGIKSVIDIPVDNIIFEGHDNDMVIPLKSSIAYGDKSLNTFTNFEETETHHLNYFTNEEIISQVINFLK